MEPSSAGTTPWPCPVAGIAPVPNGWQYPNKVTGKEQSDIDGAGVLVAEVPIDDRVVGGRNARAMHVEVLTQPPPTRPQAAFRGLTQTCFWQNGPCQLLSCFDEAAGETPQIPSRLGPMISIPELIRQTMTRCKGGEEGRTLSGLVGFGLAYLPRQQCAKAWNGELGLLRWTCLFGCRKGWCGGQQDRWPARRAKAGLTLNQSRDERCRPEDAA